MTSAVGMILLQQQAASGRRDELAATGLTPAGHQTECVQRLESFADFAGFVIAEGRLPGEVPAGTQFEEVFQQAEHE